ncbi:MAG: N-acetylmuramoyl-L-alanine amidase family protein [Candidatus Dormibacteraceae bacterium]
MLAAALVLGWASLRGGSQGPPAVSASRRAAPARHATALLTGLSPGACLLFAPVGADRHRIVFVDPGHGGVDPGALGTTSSGAPVREKDVTLGIGLDLLRRLREDGYRVVMSRVSDTTLARLGPADVTSGGLTNAAEHADTRARVECANAARAQIMISIHMNAFDDPSVGGTETIYDSARPFSPDSRHFAELVQQDLQAGFAARGWRIPDRGIKDDATLDPPAHSVRAENYGHLLELGPAQAGWLADPSRMPAALTEPLFVTDPHESDVAVTDQGRQVIAAAIELAVKSYFAPPPPRAQSPR